MKIFKILLIGLILSMPLMAMDENDIGDTMKDKIGAITKILKDQSIDKDQRNSKVIEIIDPIFDFKLMGKLSLGKKIWGSISTEQKGQFINLFDGRIKASYIKKIDLYSDEEVIIKDAKKVKKSRIHLLSFIVSKGEQSEVLYKFYPSKTRGWVIYDVDILGVSIIQTYRQQFAEIMRDGDFDKLLTKLKRDQE